MGAEKRYALDMVEETRSVRVFQVSFPLELGEQVENMAAKEGQEIDEFFRECFRAYKAERLRQAFDASNAAYEGLRLTEMDLLQGIEEVRAGRKQQKRV